MGAGEGLGDGLEDGCGSSLALHAAIGIIKMIIKIAHNNISKERFFILNSLIFKFKSVTQYYAVNEIYIMDTSGMIVFSVLITKTLRHKIARIITYYGSAVADLNPRDDSIFVCY